MKSFSMKDKVFDIVNHTALTIVGLACLYPVLYVFMASFSSGEAIAQGKVWLFPVDFNLEAYKEVFNTSLIWTGYGNSIFYTLMFTALALMLTILGAYPLSKRYLPGRKIITLLVTFTLWFNAGMIPRFLNMKHFGLLDSRLGIILMFTISTFNMILMRTFFEGIPSALEEAATIDGANDFQVLTKVYLPLSKPALATIGLFYAVGKWNNYFWSMLLLRDTDKMPLQVILKKMIVDLTVLEELQDTYIRLSLEGFVYATIIIAILPMMLVYPFISKYFQKGMMVGSIKG